MKKILHLTISSEIGGGPEHIFQLVSGISSQFESHVACPDNGPYYEKFLKAVSNRVILLPHRKFSFSYLFSTYKYIKNNKIDLLHGHGIGAGLYCRLISMFIRIPVIHTPHGINQKIEKGIINKIYIQFERLFGFLINAIIYVSKTEFDYAKQLNIWAINSAHIINNGTKIILSNEKSEWRVAKREQLNLTNEKVVITASRFDFQKNTLEFCEIAANLPDFTFVILGDGEQKKECEDYCSNLRITNVLFIGNVPDPISYFAAADVYLSTARWEGLSMAILEAMAVGLPVVATKVIGNIDLVKPSENGFLYTIGKITEATEYLQRVFDYANYINFSNNAKKIHKTSFSSESMCIKTSALYSDVLKIIQKTNS